MVLSCPMKLRLTIKWLVVVSPGYTFVCRTAGFVQRGLGSTIHGSIRLNHPWWATARKSPGEKDHRGFGASVMEVLSLDHKWLHFPGLSVMHPDEVISVGEGGGGDLRLLHAGFKNTVYI